MRHSSKWRRLLRGKEAGTTLIETLIALAILGLIAVAFVGAIGTATKASLIISEQATAERLARSETEYIKNCTYQYGAQEYPVDPALTIPNGWVVLPFVEPLHGTDDGIQKITIKVEHNGQVVLILVDYKVDR